MSDYQTEYRLGDNEHTLLRKILTVLRGGALNEAADLMEDAAASLASIARPRVASFTIATTTTPYADYDVLGGALTLFSGTDARTGHVLSATLVDPDNQGVPIELLFISGDLTNTPTDNNPINWATADYAIVIGRFSIAGVDYVRLGANGPSVATVTGVYLPFEGATKVTVVPVSLNVASYSANSLRLKIGWAA